MLDRAEWGGTGAAVVTADENYVRMRFCHTGRDGTDADLGHQLHSNTRLWIDVFQVVDQLREILNRIDVVMRGRRNQTDTWDRVPYPRDYLIDFLTGKLTAFSGLSTLCHLDLQLVGVDEVVRGHAKTR